MDVASDITTARRFGKVRCGLSARMRPSVAELAAEFGLAADAEHYDEIDADSARRLVVLLLNRDLAYNSEIMAITRATELADQFLTQFGNDGVSFHTNGTFHEARGSKLTSDGVTWSPVTSATFDTGVLVIGRQRAGCLWVEDED